MADYSTASGSEKSSADDLGWVVYLLRCADGTLYTGVTSDMARRLRQHNGEIVGGARYTRPRRPVAVVWQCTAPSRSAAQQLEARLKQWPRQQKEALVAGRCSGIEALTQAE